MVGKNDLDIWPLDLAQKYRADDQEVIRTRNRKCFEEPLRDSEKGMIWIETIKTPILNDKHEVIGTTGISRDITSRRHMEEALKESETKYRLLAENARDLIWTLDLNQQLTFASPAVQLLTGFTPEEFITLKLDQVLTPASLQVTRENIARLQEIELREKPPLPPSVTLEIELRRKDGDSIWAEVQATLMRGFQGETTGLMGVSRDITERRQVQEALRESEKRFRDISENAAEWVWETDVEGKFTYSSSVVEKVLGYKPEELLKKYFYDFFLPEERDKLRQAAFTIYRHQTAVPRLHQPKPS